MTSRRSSLETNMALDDKTYSKQTIDIIFKIATIFLIPLCVFFWSELKDLRDREYSFVTQAQLNDVEKRITDNVGVRIDSLDKKLDILIERQQK